MSNLWRDWKRKHSVLRLCAVVDLEMILLLRPILFAFIKSDAVKRLLIDCLKKASESTENTVDDKVVEFVEANLFPATRVEK